MAGAPDLNLDGPVISKAANLSTAPCPNTHPEEARKRRLEGARPAPLVDIQSDHPRCLTVNVHSAGRTGASTLIRRLFPDFPELRPDLPDFKLICVWMGLRSTEIRTL